MPNKRSIRVFAPATIGNVSCGFDILGMAVEKPGDEVVMSLSDKKGIHITSITGDQGKLPHDASKNTAGIAIRSFLDHIGSDRGIEFELHKKMPIGSGLGSSAASAVAGVFAVNELLDTPLKREDLLPFAIVAEEATSGNIHADNVAPSLIGGLVLIKSYEPLKIKSIPLPADLHITLVYPHVEILTRDARNILPKTFPLETGVKQWSNVAALISAAYENDIDGMGNALTDHIAEPYRSKLIPHFDRAKQTAMESGACGFGISGSGPTLFSFSDSEKTSVKIGQMIESLYNKNNIDTSVYLSRINNKGAEIIE
ncbi:MAG: homoserine kinase [Bacteroidia bacterium]|nr:homoserine kinase [Bacteroidia bacterium]